MFRSIRLLRPFNLLFSGLCVLAAGYLVRPNVALPWQAAFVVILVAAWGYILNDIFDLPIDRINKPQRPLPSGQIHLRTAWILACSLVGLGLFLAFQLSWMHGVIACFCAVSLFIYAVFGKHIMIFGHIIVALNTMLVFVFGAWPQTSPKLNALLGLVAFFTLNREWAKAIEDEVGDRNQHAQTLAILAGVASTWETILFFYLISMFWLFFFAPILGKPLFLYGFSIAFIGFGLGCLGKRKICSAARIQQAYKGLMLLILIGFII